MRYKVKGCEIRSENAAKPHSMRSAVVAAYLREADKVDAVLDYGCGKLRYGDLISQIGNRVTFVDSRIQLTRPQRLRGKRTTVKDFVQRNYSNACAIAAEEWRSGRPRYDFVTCINVLSAIASRAALNRALEVIRSALRKNGLAVFVNQHTNSSFTRYAAGKKHLFGHLYEVNGRNFYYGLLSASRVSNLLTNRGFAIRRSWQSGEINFVEAHLG
jgi:2-polyprenyl-3-methyl-5-hydroxy-6-metoxy-1,4-benzoquinol methylase